MDFPLIKYGREFFYGIDCIDSQGRKTELESALEICLKFKGAEGKAQRTLYDYRYHISLFFSKHPQAYTNEKEARYSLLDHLAESKIPSTHNLRLQYLRAFFKWLWEENGLNNSLNPIRKMKDVYSSVKNLFLGLVFNGVQWTV